MTNALTCATSLKSDRQVACCTLLLQCAHLHSSANTDLQLQTYTLQQQFIFLSCKNGGPFCNNNVSLQWQNSFLFLQLAKLIATLQLQKKPHQQQQQKTLAPEHQACSSATAKKCCKNGRHFSLLLQGPYHQCKTASYTCWCKSKACCCKVHVCLLLLTLTAHSWHAESAVIAIDTIQELLLTVTQIWRSSMGALWSEKYLQGFATLELW